MSLELGPIARSRAFKVLGRPSATFRMNDMEGTVQPDGRLVFEVPDVQLGSDAGQTAVFEWACNGVPPGAACTAIERDGVFTLVMVCAFHATSA